MRLNRILVTVLSLTVLTLALASPAAAAAAPTSPVSAANDMRGCEQIDAIWDTVFVEPTVEVGAIKGDALEGAAFLRFDEAAPPIDPQWNRPNLVITNMFGTINLWVHSEAKPGAGWRDFEILGVTGRGFYGGQKIVLDIYGIVDYKVGSYVIKGLICPALSSP